MEKLYNSYNLNFLNSGRSFVYDSELGLKRLKFECEWDEKMYLIGLLQLNKLIVVDDDDCARPVHPAYTMIISSFIANHKIQINQVKL